MIKAATDAFKVAIIGGGAAGLFCAGMCAASLSEKEIIALFEKNKSQKELSSERFFDNAYLGKKLLITGKGRCNLTNLCTLDEFIKNVPGNGKFLFSAFGAFPPDKLMEHFENLGVPLKVERGNRVFPVSDKALDILSALKNHIKRGENCKVYNRCVKNIEKEEELFKISDTDGNVYFAQKVIVCTGGLSYPVTGSTGDGYKFAKAFGHTVTELRPSLVPLVSSDSCITTLQGLSLKNVKLSVFENEIEKNKNKKIFSEMGEMLFTHFGVSGPLVLSASAHMRKFGKCTYSVSIDLKPALDEKTLDLRLLSDFEKYINKNLDNALCDLLPKSMIPAVISKAGLESGMKPNSISKKQRHALLSTLKNFSLEIDGFSSIDCAVITSGGVKTSEINPSTMESKLVPGLYFAGEVIDVDAYTGGFNLQIAFSTAFLAAKACIENSD